MSAKMKENIAEEESRMVLRWETKGANVKKGTTGMRLEGRRAMMRFAVFNSLT
jgi:hypothetical protein